MFVIRRNAEGYPYLSGNSWAKKVEDATHFDSAHQAIQHIAQQSGQCPYDLEIVEFVEPEPAPRWVEKRVVA